MGLVPCSFCGTVLARKHPRNTGQEHYARAGEALKRTSLVAAGFAVGTLFVTLLSPMVVGGAAPAVAADAPVVASLASLREKELKWGLSHADVTDLYNLPGALLDREYAPKIARLQPGVDMQQLESDRDSRKLNFQHSYSVFGDSPSGYDVTAIHSEYTYKNEEGIQRIFKDGRTRFFFYIKDRLWKLYDEVPLKAGSPARRVVPGRDREPERARGRPGSRQRAPDAAQNIERTTTDWQDASTHLRAIDRSGEHLVGIVLEDRSTLARLASLRVNKPRRPVRNRPDRSPPSPRTEHQRSPTPPTRRRPDAGARQRCTTSRGTRSTATAVPRQVTSFGARARGLRRSSSTTPAFGDDRAERRGQDDAVARERRSRGNQRTADSGKGEGAGRRRPSGRDASRRRLTSTRGARTSRRRRLDLLLRCPGSKPLALAFLFISTRPHGSHTETHQVLGAVHLMTKRIMNARRRATLADIDYLVRSWGPWFERRPSRPRRCHVPSRARARAADTGAGALRGPGRRKTQSWLATG